ncbi:hypothetical protein AVEN_102525-1 [Araneus ventricosus]|uniref:Uncharacterized protein n=1 Tax=Araneus ventricosus TaxID=182803 RepID=A0A4Y2BJM4_ARAVE|nr:hypothetical protein AVEN_102525-1 [Araneus ventricosus]
MTRTTPELVTHSPNFRATPTRGRLATTDDLACNRPHTRRIFSGIGFRTCDPPVRGRDLTTRSQRPSLSAEDDSWIGMGASVCQEVQIFDRAVNFTLISIAKMHSVIDLVQKYTLRILILRTESLKCTFD